MRGPQHRVSEDSLAFSQKSQELSTQSFMALHSGIGLGGVVVPRPSLLSSLAASVIESRRDERTAQPTSVPKQYRTPRFAQIQSGRSQMAWLRVLLTPVVDLSLVAIGLTVVVAGLAVSRQEFVDVVLEWQSQLSRAEWIACTGATIISAYFSYWLCFLSLVGRTPGQGLLQRDHHKQRRHLDIRANALIRKA